MAAVPPGWYKNPAPAETLEPLDAPLQASPKMLGTCRWCTDDGFNSLGDAMILAAQVTLDEDYPWWRTTPLGETRVSLATLVKRNMEKSAPALRDDRIFQDCIYKAIAVVLARGCVEKPAATADKPDSP